MTLFLFPHDLLIRWHKFSTLIGSYTFSQSFSCMFTGKSWTQFYFFFPFPFLFLLQKGSVETPVLMFLLKTFHKRLFHVEKMSTNHFYFGEKCKFQSITIDRFLLYRMYYSVKNSFSFFKRRALQGSCLFIMT